MQKVTNVLHIDLSAMMQTGGVNRLITAMLAFMIAVFVVKNVYLLFQTYVQNTFVTRNRNKMISRVMREFLNRPYEEYLGADIPTVFRLTDSDIPMAFQLILVLIQMITEVVVSVFLCIVLVVVSPVMTLFIVVIFLGMTLLLSKLLKPRLNAIGKKKSGNPVQNSQMAHPVYLWSERCQSIKQGRVFYSELL